jgi:hypothetical protein
MLQQEMERRSGDFVPGHHAEALVNWNSKVTKQTIHQNLVAQCTTVRVRPDRKASDKKR